MTSCDLLKNSYLCRVNNIWLDILNAESEL